MQMRTRLAKWLDRSFGITSLYLFCSLWFWIRTDRFLLALMLSAVFTAMVVYAACLFSRRSSRRKHLFEQQRLMQEKAVYALTMLAQEDAAGYASEALQKAFELPPDAVVCVVQSPAKANAKDVHAFHKQRNDQRCVLVCAGGFDADAQAYADRLSPALRLVDAGELEWTRELADMFPQSFIAEKKRTGGVLHPIMKRELAVRCMVLSAVFAVVYILTGRMTVLLPMMGLICFALLCKRKEAAKRTLF